jgi:hypothetical protein
MKLAIVQMRELRQRESSLSQLHSKGAGLRQPRLLIIYLSSLVLEFEPKAPTCATAPALNLSN